MFIQYITTRKDDLDDLYRATYNLTSNSCFLHWIINKKTDIIRYRGHQLFTVRSYSLSADFLTLTNGICKWPLHITGNETYYNAKILLCSVLLSFLVPNLPNTRPDSVHTAVQHWPSLWKFHTWAREVAGVIQRVLKTTSVTIPLEKLDTWTSVMLQSVEWANHGSWELLQKAVDYFQQKTPYLTSSMKQILQKTVQVLKCT